MRVKSAFDDFALATQAHRMTNSGRLEAAIAAAAAAAELIRASYRGVSNVRTKQDGSPVTDADVAAEQAIRSIVQGRFPEDGFYGEESPADRLDAERLWIVDPIDGTKSFVRRYPMFSTQIHASKVLVSAIHPMSSDSCHGENGAAVSPATRPKDAQTLMRSRAE